ncbi:MAG: efflux RND transporter permease subunit, partial [Pseudomonadota bacterium]
MQRGTPYARSLQVYDQVASAIDTLSKELSEKNGDREIVESYETWVVSRGIFSFINLAEADQRSENLATITDRLRELIGPVPDASELNFTSNFTEEGSNRFRAGLQSTNLEELTQATIAVKEYLSTAAELYDIRDSLEASQDEIRLALKPGAERFGLTIGEVSRQVRQAFYGEESQRLPRDGQDVRVMVRYPLEVRQSLDSLSNMRIRTADGREIALEAVAEVTFAPAVRRIIRTDRMRSANIFARIRQDADAGPLKRDFHRDFVPLLKAQYPGIEVKRRGEDKEQQDFTQSITSLYLLALFGMYMLLAIAFGSYFQPLMIMSAIPFGFMGAVFGHLLLGEDFAMFSMFGICAAGGVVINDNLVLVDYVNRLRREGAGALAALVEAGVVRFRPILLTSVTTFVGLVPILLEQSFDAQFLRPMIISLAFGVLFA